MRQTVFFMLTISMPAIPGYYFLAAVLKCCDIQPKTMDMRRADHRSLQVLPQVAYITCNSAHPVSLLVTPGFRLASQNTTATREQAGQPCRSDIYLGSSRRLCEKLRPPSPSSGFVIPPVISSLSLRSRIRCKHMGGCFHAAAEPHGRCLISRMLFYLGDKCRPLFLFFSGL